MNFTAFFFFFSILPIPRFWKTSGKLGKTNFKEILCPVCLVFQKHGNRKHILVGSAPACPEAIWWYFGFNLLYTVLTFSQS